MNDHRNSRDSSQSEVPLVEGGSTRRVVGRLPHLASAALPTLMAVLAAFAMPTAAAASSVATITISSTPNPVAPEGRLGYQVTARNNGTALIDVRVAVTLDPDLSLFDWNAIERNNNNPKDRRPTKDEQAGGVAHVENTNLWTFKKLSGNEIRSFWIEATVAAVIAPDPGNPDRRSVKTTAVADSIEVDVDGAPVAGESWEAIRPDPSNRTEVVEVSEGGGTSPVAIFISANPNPVGPGGKLAYRISFANKGAVDRQMKVMLAFGAPLKLDTLTWDSLNCRRLCRGQCNNWVGTARMCWNSGVCGDNQCSANDTTCDTDSDCAFPDPDCRARCGVQSNLPNQGTDADNPDDGQEPGERTEWIFPSTFLKAENEPFRQYDDFSYLHPNGTETFEVQIDLDAASLIDKVITTATTVDTPTIGAERDQIPGTESFSNKATSTVAIDVCADLDLGDPCDNGDVCPGIDTCQQKGDSDPPVKECRGGPCPEACAQPVQAMDGTQCFREDRCTTYQCVEGQCVPRVQGRSCNSSGDCDTEMGESCIVHVCTSPESEPVGVVCPKCAMCVATEGCVPDPGKAGQVCRYERRTCDAEETCTGVDSGCPFDGHLGDTGLCDDFDPDTINETCEIEEDPDGNPATPDWTAECGGGIRTKCGDGDIDGDQPYDEQCDDGARLDGDCCSATCRFEPQSSPCEDDTVCNGAETCDGAGECQPGTPLDCTAASVCTTSNVCHPMDGCVYNPLPASGCLSGWARGSLVIDEVTAGREKLSLKMANGPVVSQADFGDPLGPGGTAYTTCFYRVDNGAFAGFLRVDRAGDQCGRLGCWQPRGSTGYRYSDNAYSADGIGRITLNSGPKNEAQIQLRGRNSATKAQLGLPSGDRSLARGLNRAFRGVRVQFRPEDPSQCFEATFARVRRAGPTYFKANQ